METTNFNHYLLSVDTDDSSSVDAAIDIFLLDPILKKRIYERIKYNISSLGKYFFESIDSMISDGVLPRDVTPLLRSISQLENEVSYLSHQLINYDSLINKYDKLAVKVDYLKRQNKRLSNRNLELVRALHSSKNNR